MKIIKNILLCRAVPMETPNSEGVILPEIRKGSFQEFIVLDFGPKVEGFKIGDHVLVHKALPSPVIYGEETLYFINLNHVEAILD